MIQPEWPDRDAVASPVRQRKIIHIDMDAFFASVEQRDNPELRCKPVAVGGSRERGVVAAASYEARTFGVRSAMPSVTAKRRCPDLIFVMPRFDVSKAVSLQIHEILAEHTAIIEPLSLDEAYLGVTENLKGHRVSDRVRRGHPGDDPTRNESDGLCRPRSTIGAAFARALGPSVSAGFPCPRPRTRGGEAAWADRERSTGTPSTSPVDVTRLQPFRTSASRLARRSLRSTRGGFS
jgi:nucleotidyltransferase/DNA polymerase involved in DNA repair